MQQIKEELDQLNAHFDTLAMSCAGMYPQVSQTIQL